MVSSIEHVECLVDLSTLFAIKKGLLCAVKMSYIQGKTISMHLSRYEKKNLFIDLSKFLKIMRQ